jgi:DNA-binding Lrp family transcriptional regulator
MPKSSNKQIEEDRNKIIKELKSNSRQSPHEIAKKLGFSRQKVWKIIKELEKENIIWGYTAVVDDTDKSIFFAVSKLKAPIYQNIDQILKNLKEDTESMLNVSLVGSFYINGIYDWLVVFTAENILDAKKFCTHIQKLHVDYIDRIELMETIFPLIKFGKINPNVEKLREFEIV